MMWPFRTKIAAPTIETYYHPKPVPSTMFDWEAIRDGYDAGDPIGYGSTEEQAIKELIQIEEERNI